VTASATFPASNYRFTIGTNNFTPGGATLASGWSVSCGLLLPPTDGSDGKTPMAINVMVNVSVSATNNNTGQTVTASPQSILFSKPAGAC